MIIKKIMTHEAAIEAIDIKLISLRILEVNRLIMRAL